MALDQSYIGRVYPPDSDYAVGREKIREFADAIGDADPACRDVTAAQAHGYADVIAPPTFAIVLTWEASKRIIADPELGLDFARVVHGDQRFVHERPIVAGDVLQATVTVDNIRSVAGNDLITTRAELATGTGELVATGWSTLVARGETE